MIQRLACAITVMRKTVPTDPLIKEVSLVPAEGLLEDRQLRYMVATP